MQNIFLLVSAYVCTCQATSISRSDVGVSEQSRTGQSRMEPFEIETPSGSREIVEGTPPPIIDDYIHLIRSYDEATVFTWDNQVLSMLIEQLPEIPDDWVVLDRIVSQEIEVAPMRLRGYTM